MAESVVDATLPHLSSVLQDMIRLQRATGMRSGEVCIVRPCDLDRNGEVWTFKPHRHKLEHKGLDRKYLLREPTSYCFIWTDEDLFERFRPLLEASHFPRAIGGFAELAELLRSVQPNVRLMVVDPEIAAPRFHYWDIDRFLATIQFDRSPE